MKYHPLLMLIAAVFAGFMFMGCQNPAGSKSDNANLSVLGLSNVTLTPVFSADATSYTASIPNSVASTTVTATAAHAGAAISINPGTSPINLVEGANNITVTVTAENGTTTKNYSVTVTRAAPVITASDNADLATFSLSNIALSPAFRADIMSYTALVNNPTVTTAVTATAAAAGATVAVNPNGTINLAEGDNLITVTVTAADGTTRKIYTVTVTRSAVVTTYYNDAFAGAVSSENLVTTAYRALTDDPARPMYLNVRGTAVWQNGTVTLDANDRFSIGANEITPTTATTTPGGCFDFSVPTTLRIQFGAAGTGAVTGFFQVYVNNNTTATRNSPLGTSSRVFIRSAQAIAVGTIVDIPIPLAAGADSFITFVADSEVTSVQIDEITLIR